MTDTTWVVGAADVGGRKYGVWLHQIPGFSGEDHLFDSTVKKAVGVVRRRRAWASVAGLRRALRDAAGGWTHGRYEIVLRELPDAEWQALAEDADVRWRVCFV